MADYSQYTDMGAPIGVPIRKHRWCPFCETRTSGFVVIPDYKGFLLFCHKCHKKKWIPRGGTSPSMVKRLLATPKTRTAQEVYLPADFDYMLPAVALVWLYKYGITDDIIKALRFGYSEKYHRLIMPCWQGETLVHWTGRYLGNHKKDKTPKYVSRTRSENHYWVYNPSGSTAAVLVEDILSAIKVGMAGYAGVALHGSYAVGSVIDSVSKMFSSLTMWLDLDKLQSSVKIARRYKALGYNVSALCTAKKDPKEYTTKEIQKYLTKETKDENIL